MLERKPVTTHEEVDQLFLIVKEIWQECFTPIIGEKQVAYMLKHYQSPAKIQSEIAHGVKYFALYAKETLVGYTAFEEQGLDILYISKLYIHEDYRGKGYMGDVFAWYDRVAKETHRRQKLQVNQQNTQAITVYKHLGFKVVGPLVTNIGEGFVMEDFIMEK